MRLSLSNVFLIKACSPPDGTLGTGLSETVLHLRSSHLSVPLALSQIPDRRKKITVSGLVIAVNDVKTIEKIPAPI